MKKREKDVSAQVIRGIEPRIKINADTVTEQTETVQDGYDKKNRIQVLTDERNRLEEQSYERVLKGHAVQDGIIKTWMSLRIKELEELASKEDKERLWRRRYSESEYDRISVGDHPTYVLKGHKEN